jgi:hypothetical protein
MIEASDLSAFAEDARALIAIGPDEERIDLGSAVVTFSPGGHYWSAGVARIRFGDDVPSELERVRAEIRGRGRRAAAWTVGDSATPPGAAERLLELGLESEPGGGSLVMVLTDPPEAHPTAFRVVVVETFDQHLAAIDVADRGFEHPAGDAADERLHARESFEVEREGCHTARLLAFDGDLPVATGRAWYGPGGLYLGGGATIPTHRRRGAMRTLVTAAWGEAVRRGTPALVAYGNAMSAPLLEGLGFRSTGRVRHLIDHLG